MSKSPMSLGLISINPTIRSNSLSILYEQLISKYGDPATYFDDLEFQIPTQNSNKYIVSNLLKSLKISMRKCRNKQYDEKLKNDIIFKIFECLFYFIGNKTFIKQIETESNMEWILDIIKTFKVSNYCSNKTLKMMLFRQLLLTCFVERILISTNHREQTGLVFFHTKFYLNMVLIHETIINLLQKSFASYHSMNISLIHLTQRNFECLISFFLQLFESTNAVIACFNCFTRFFKHIAFLCQFIYQQNRTNIDKLLLMLLKILSFIIRSDHEFDDMHEFIVNYKISVNNNNNNNNDNDSYFIDWVFTKIVQNKKSIMFHKAFWKFMKNLCVHSWPHRFYELHYFEIPGSLTVSIADFIQYSDVLRKNKCDLGIVKDICFILRIGLEDSINLHSKYIFNQFCINTFLSNKYITSSLLRLYHQNKANDDFEFLENIVSLFFDEAFIGNRCCCALLIRLMRIDFFPICFEMIQKCSQYIMQNNQDLQNALDRAFNLLLGSLSSIQVVLAQCSNECIIQTQADFSGNCRLSKQAFNVYSQYSPYPLIDDNNNNALLEIQDKSISFNNEFPVEHHLIKTYPQYFVWQIKKCGGIEKINQVIKLKNYLNVIPNGSIKQMLNDQNLIPLMEEGINCIFDFVEKHDFDEKQMEIDLVDLKGKVDIIENALYCYDNKVNIEHSSIEQVEYIGNRIIDYIHKIDEMFQLLSDPDCIITNRIIINEMYESAIAAIYRVTRNFDIALYILLSTKFIDSINNIFKNMSLFHCVLNIQRQTNQNLSIISDSILNVIRLIYNLSIYDVYGRINGNFGWDSGEINFWRAFVNFMTIYSVGDNGNINNNIWQNICIHFYMIFKRFKFRYMSSTKFCVYDDIKDTIPPIQYFIGFESLIYDLHIQCSIFTNDQMLKYWQKSAKRNSKCANFKCKHKRRDKMKHFGRCNGCWYVYYCSIQCQKYHWKHGHRLQCQSIQHRRNTDRIHLP